MAKTQRSGLTMKTLPALDAVENLETTPATAFKTQGWRHVMKRVAGAKKLVVTNHKDREAVILTVEEYERLLRLAGEASSIQEDSLEKLRLRFDERLAVLQSPHAADRLRAVMAGHASLEGTLRAQAKR
jgi:PHD/YefM family antitoxin component YafN of YafNO toxin-antitoxin module